MPNAYRIVRSRTVHHGPVFDVTVNEVRLRDGTRTRVDIVEHPGAVALVPLLADGRVLLIHQLRVPARRRLYELPAGTHEPGESPATTARRELREETGYRARRVRRIAEFYTAPGFCTELLRVYLATGLTPAPAEPDEDERIRVVPTSLSKALRMIREGQIRDAKSILGLLIAEREIPK